MITLCLQENINMGIGDIKKYLRIKLNKNNILHTNLFKVIKFFTIDTLITFKYEKEKVFYNTEYFLNGQNFFWQKIKKLIEHFLNKQQISKIHEEYIYEKRFTFKSMRLLWL